MRRDCLLVEGFFRGLLSSEGGIRSGWSFWDCSYQTLEIAFGVWIGIRILATWA